MEDLHPEGESPFIVKDGLNELDALDQPVGTVEDLVDDLDFVDCPREGCGEKIPLAELDSHTDMHEAENDEGDHDSQPAKRQKRDILVSASSFDTSISPTLRNLAELSGDIPLSSSRANTNTVQSESAKAKWGKLLKMPGQKHSLGNDSAAKKPYRRLGVGHPYLSYSSELGTDLYF